MSELLVLLGLFPLGRRFIPEGKRDTFRTGRRREGRTDVNNCHHTRATGRVVGTVLGCVHGGSIQGGVYTGRYTQGGIPGGIYQGGIPLSSQHARLLTNSETGRGFSGSPVHAARCLIF